MIYNFRAYVSYENAQDEPEMLSNQYFSELPLDTLVLFLRSTSTSAIFSGFQNEFYILILFIRVFFMFC